MATNDPIVELVLSQLDLVPEETPPEMQADLRALLVRDEPPREAAVLLFEGGR